MADDKINPILDTKSVEYTRRLTSQQSTWKKCLDVQAPYRRHIQSLNLGRVLEIGCGIGRNLVNLGEPHYHLGIDHNPSSIAIARQRGLNVMTSDEFAVSLFSPPYVFDTLLLSHLIEHLKYQEAAALIKKYSICIKPHGLLMIVTPQEKGFASDPTHVTFFDPQRTKSLTDELGLDIVRQYSFPFPRWVGRFFKYNEFICLARYP